MHAWGPHSGWRMPGGKNALMLGHAVHSTAAKWAPPSEVRGAHALPLHAGMLRPIQPDVLAALQAGRRAATVVWVLLGSLAAARANGARRR